MTSRARKASRSRLESYVGNELVTSSSQCQTTCNDPSRDTSSLPAGKVLVFREPRTAEELLSLLQLRYRVYRNSRMKGFCAENPDQLDIDPWDWLAGHWGLFEVDGQIQTPVGYIRIVGDPAAPELRMLDELATKYNSIRKAASCRATVPLPCLTYPDPDGAGYRFYSRLVGAKKIAVEPGRLAILPGARAIRRAKFMVDCAMAIYLLSQRSIDEYLIFCCVHHREFYKPYGAKLVPGAGATFYEKADGDFQPLCGDAASLPYTILPHLESLARQFDSTGQVTIQLGQTAPTCRPIQLCEAAPVSPVIT